MRFDKAVKNLTDSKNHEGEKLLLAQQKFPLYTQSNMSVSCELSLVPNPKWSKTKL